MMSVTASENKTGLGSLVGVKAEDLPNPYARGFTAILVQCRNCLS
ncbi:hypothetical protein [Aphanizomenon flos-aquae]|nr:hypothetical protein [Aphanizomenon flos-aquae]